MALTKQQVAARADGIGGSELGKIMGLSAFGGPRDVWALKVHGISTFKENAAMRLGTMMEPLHAERIAKEDGVQLMVAAEYFDQPKQGDTELYKHLSGGTLQSKQYPHMLITPDYIQLGVPLRIRELKCVGVWSGANAFSQLGQKPVYPPDYKVQCKAQMLVSGIYLCTLDVLVQPGKLPDKFVNAMWAEWQVDPRRVEWWLRDYCAKCERRTYEVHHKPDKAPGLGLFVEDWWTNYVVTETPDPAWPTTPPKKQWRYDASRQQQLAAQPDGWEGGW